MDMCKREDPPFYVTRKYARALQQEKNNISAFPISPHTLFHVLYVNTMPDLYCRFACFLPSLARQILIVVGLVGVVATTQLMPFSPTGPPPSRSCGCILIWLLHGDLRGTVTSTILSYDDVTRGLLITTHKSSFTSIIRHECPLITTVYSLSLF